MIKLFNEKENILWRVISTQRTTPGRWLMVYKLARKRIDFARPIAVSVPEPELLLRSKRDGLQYHPLVPGGVQATPPVYHG